MISETPSSTAEVRDSMSFVKVSRGPWEDDLCASMSVLNCSRVLVLGLIPIPRAGEAEDHSSGDLL